MLGKAHRYWLAAMHTSPETGLATTALILRRARKYRGVTVSEAVARYFSEHIFCLFSLLCSLVFKNIHAGTRVI
jgi:hypothetical protein